MRGAECAESSGGTLPPVVIESPDGAPPSVLGMNALMESPAGALLPVLLESPDGALPRIEIVPVTEALVGASVTVLESPDRALLLINGFPVPGLTRLVLVKRN